jgi:choice-of-anchor C domain-containing protein
MSGPACLVADLKVSGRQGVGTLFNNPSERFLTSSFGIHLSDTSDTQFLASTKGACMSTFRLLLLLTLGWLVASPTAIPGDELPGEATKRIKQFELEAEAIRKKANDDIDARHDKLIADMKQLQEKYSKDGDLDAALAIRERIRQLQASADRARNLLVNGSFEEGPDLPKGPNAFLQLDNGSTALPGWVVSLGNIDVVDTSYNKAAHGKRSLDLSGSVPGAISQTFKTKKGQKYRVTFALAGTAPDAGPKERKLQISAGGKTEEFTFDSTDKTRNDMGWVRKTWEFTAQADKTMLEFVSLTEGNLGPALDDVVVVAIRE